MFCPILKDDCKGESCAWYSKDYETCAVLLTGEGLSDISVSAEDKGIKVIIDDD